MKPGIVTERVLELRGVRYNSVDVKIRYVRNAGTHTAEVARYRARQ